MTLRCMAHMPQLTSLEQQSKMAAVKDTVKVLEVAKGYIRHGLTPPSRLPTRLGIRS